MKSGSDEWFREEAEKLARDLGIDELVTIEPALRRVWNEAVEECAKQPGLCAFEYGREGGESGAYVTACTDSAGTIRAKKVSA